MNYFVCVFIHYCRKNQMLCIFFYNASCIIFYIRRNHHIKQSIVYINKRVVCQKEVRHLSPVEYKRVNSYSCSLFIASLADQSIERVQKGSTCWEDQYKSMHCFCYKKVAHFFDNMYQESWMGVVSFRLILSHFDEELCIKIYKKVFKF